MALNDTLKFLESSFCYSVFTKLIDKFLLTAQWSGSQFTPNTTGGFLTFKSVCNDKVILIQFEECF